MIGRKPSVARGTKIVDKMIRQIEKEISAFEAVHAKTAKKVESMDAKYDAAYERISKVRYAIYNFASKLEDIVDKVVYKVTDATYAKLEANRTKKADLQAKNVEHTADIAKLERIRDKVATLAD